MDNRISEVPLGSGLVSFSPLQIQLIKTRLYQYRAISSRGRAPLSWEAIARRISDLPESTHANSEEAAILKKRFRYYLITQSRRRRGAPSSKDISEGNFSVSDDSLHRWYSGQSDGHSGKKPYTPSKQILAAVRDFLLVTGLVLEPELDIDDPIIALMLAINDTARYDPRASLGNFPSFAPMFYSFATDGTRFIVHTLHTETFEEVGYVQFIFESKVFININPGQIKNMIDQSRQSTPISSTISSGYLALGLAPSFMLYTCRRHNSKILTHYHPIQIVATKGSEITFFELIRHESYRHKQGRFLPQTQKNASHIYVNSDIDELFDYWQGNMYNTIRNFNEIHFVENIDEVILSIEEDSERARRLYDTVFKACNENSSKIVAYIEMAVQMIRDGADINFSPPGTRFSTLHLAAQYGLKDIIDALTDVESVDYNARDELGRFPFDLAFQIPDDYVGPILCQRSAEQCAREGVDFQTLVGAHTAEQPGGPETPEVS